ncbi:glycosyltransferase [Chishuiella changwenlii]|uniref:glycosyltransferase n=1 Tax=Chishuiella changwenlii TaxID=1434701 RepID=UPI002FDACDE9
MNEPIKICVLADQHSLYDSRIYWKEAVSLVKKGYQVHYICIGEDDDSGITDEGVHYILIKRKKYLKIRILNYFLKRVSFISSEYNEAVNYCKKINADVYHVHDARINRILNDLKSISPHAKFIYDVHEPFDKNLKDDRFKNSKIPKLITNYYADYIQKWEYKKASYYDYILTTDDGLYKRFQQNTPNVKIDIIYNFTNLEKEREYLSYEKKIYDAAYIGGISKIRGALIAIKAAKLIVEKIPNYKLLLLGKIYDLELEDEIISFIKTYHLENNIILKDFIPHQEVSKFYNQIKIGLNTLLNVKAHEEIIQIKLFEYMNFGIPIITSDFGYMKQYVEENNVGIAVKPNDENLLANTIIALLKDRNAFEVYAANGINAVNEKYNWNKMEQKLFYIYENLLNEK